MRKIKMKPILFLLLLTGFLWCYHVSPGYSAPTIKVVVQPFELTGGVQHTINTHSAAQKAATAAADYFHDVGFTHYDPKIKKQKKEDMEKEDLRVELKLMARSGKTKLVVYSDATMFDAEGKQIADTSQASEAYIHGNDINFALSKACTLVGRRSAKYIVNKLRKNPNCLNREYRLVFTGFKDRENQIIEQTIKNLARRDKDIKNDIQRQGLNPLTVSMVMGIHKKLTKFVYNLITQLKEVEIEVTRSQPDSDDTAFLVRQVQEGEIEVN